MEDVKAAVGEYHPLPCLPESRTKIFYSFSRYQHFDAFLPVAILNVNIIANSPTTASGGPPSPMGADIGYEQ